jgi:hypothetical protein
MTIGRCCPDPIDVVHRPRARIQNLEAAGRRNGREAGDAADDLSDDEIKARVTQEGIVPLKLLAYVAASGRPPRTRLRQIDVTVLGEIESAVAVASERPIGQPQVKLVNWAVRDPMATPRIVRAHALALPAACTT